MLIAYAWVFSLVAFDFVMALDPHWFSTLMGAYYFVGNLLVGIAFVSIVSVWGRGRLGLHDYIGTQQLHDIGKLLFGFSILWAYMVWSQYLVIWYGDLPEETEFVYPPDVRGRGRRSPGPSSPSRSWCHSQSC